jgi:exopolyphosphatase / guanosine-5'-triphosphate,3'-diphosphate pyrophosphatase
VRYAAIDIGSNAVRLLIANIIESDGGLTFKKDTLIRVPLRLGDDAFMLNKLSDKKAKELTQTMISFRNLMDVFHVDDYSAYATSAMREAKNGAEIVKKINKITDIKIEIINGFKEAQIIYSSHIEQTLDPKHSYLYVDVGGGSTEVSVFSKNQLLASNSFNIGTIRMLDNKDTEEEWELMRNWIKDHTKSLRPLLGIGTGGNINKLHRLSGEKENYPLTYAKIKAMYNYLNSFSLKDRIKVLDLNQDRADVIIPASEIYLNVMKWGNVKYIYVPKVGLVDGIIQQLIEKNNK